jgi:hypothetical protein
MKVNELDRFKVKGGSEGARSRIKTAGHFPAQGFPPDGGGP